MKAPIRPATTDDAAGIAEVQVRGWQQAYAGQISADYLDSMSVERATRGWSNQVTNLGPTGSLLVADHDGAIAGFVCSGPQRGADAQADTGEVYAIYVSPTRWRGGIGRVLIEAATESLRDNGFRSAKLWVLRSNTAARDFYTAVGWVADGAERTEDFNDTLVTEVRYALALD